MRYYCILLQGLGQKRKRGVMRGKREDDEGQEEGVAEQKEGGCRNKHRKRIGNERERERERDDRQAGRQTEGVTKRVERVSGERKREKKKLERKKGKGRAMGWPRRGRSAYSLPFF